MGESNTMMDLRGSSLSEVTISSSGGLMIRNMICRLCLKNECETASSIATWDWLSLYSSWSSIIISLLEVTI